MSTAQVIKYVAGAYGTNVYLVYDGDTKDAFVVDPGYEFKVLDGLLTNFHLPESTLIMLVSALAGREAVLRAYREAVEKRYRFFSFGDAMLIADFSREEQNGEF